MRLIPVLAALLLLAACDTVREYTPDLRFGKAETATRAEERPAVDPQTLVKRRVASAGRMEIGRTFDGYMLAVFGEAPATGWFAPELRPLNEGAVAADGFLELEFVAAAPEDNAGQPGDPAAGPVQRAIRADYEITRRALVGVRGVRIVTQGAPIQGVF